MKERHLKSAAGSRATRRSSGSNQSFGSRAGQILRDLLAKAGADAGHRGDLLRGASSHSLDGAEDLQQGLLARAETPGISSRTLSLIRFLSRRLWKLLAKRCASSRIRCSSFKAPLSSGSLQRQRAPRPVDLLKLLGQADNRLMEKPEALKFLARAGELSLAAINDDQIRQAEVVVMVDG